MKRKWFHLAVVAMLVFGLAACNGTAPSQSSQPAAPAETASSPSSSGNTSPPQSEAGSGYTISDPVTIELWHPISNPVHAEVLDAMIAEFNSGIGAEKGITVNATLQGNTAELATNVVAALRAGNAPDVTMGYRINVADYLQTDYVVDLTPYINDPEVGIKDLNDFFPTLLTGGNSYGKEGMFSLPIHSFTELMYYDKDFFADNNLAVPTTWEEVEDISRKITAITGKPAFGWDNLSSSFIDLVLQHGGSFTTPQGDMPFIEDPVTLDVLKMWQDNVNEGIWRTAGEDMFFSGPFANGVVQMFVGDSVEASYISDKNPALNWSAAALPQAGGSTPAAITGGHVILALNSTGNADKEYASYELIKFLTSTEANLQVVQITGYLPIRQSVVDNAGYQNYVAQSGGKGDAQRVGVEQSSAYVYEPVFSSGNKTSSAVNAAVKQMMQAVAETGAAPETALGDLAASVG